MDWLESIFRFLFAWIDKIIAWAIEQSYILFELIADTNIFSGEILQMFSRRVYALLAIFMLFKLAFSLINYIINPDDFTDKSKGASKLIMNVFIVLGLIVSMPYIFSLAYDLQGLVIKQGVIQKVILGVGGGTPNGQEVSAGKIMAFTVYSAFITPNPDYPGMEDKCDKLYSDREVSSDCESVVRTAAGQNGLTLLKNAVNTYDSQSLLNYDLVVHAKTNGQFLFSYIPLISSICAGLVAWIILLFCIDISIRVVKLGFLQLISPIPIISYIDPKSSKEGLFKKWTKLCISTYADIFVRLAAISFAVFIINIIGTGKITRISDPTEEILFTTHPFVKIFILLGCLLFAKQLPKMIEDLTGIKMGGFSLNPMKKIGESPYASAAIGGLVGAGAGAAGSFAANRAIGNNVGRSLLGGAGGLFAGGARGVTGGLKADGKGSPIATGLSAGGKSGANVLKRDGTTFGSRMSASAASSLGLNTEADVIDAKVKDYGALAKDADSVLKKANGEMLKNKYNNLSFTDSAGASFTMKDVRMNKEKIASLRSMDTSGMTAAQRDAHLDSIDSLQGTVGLHEKLAEQAFVDAVMSGSATDVNGELITDAEITAKIGHMQQTIKDSTDATIKAQSVANGKSIKKTKDSLNDTIVTIENDSKTAVARASRDAVKKSK